MNIVNEYGYSNVLLFATVLEKTLLNVCNLFMYCRLCICNIYIFLMMNTTEADITFIANRSIAIPVVIIRTWLNQLLANCNYYSPRRIFVPRYFFLFR